MLNKIKPQYFDILGIITFPFIFCLALYVIVTGNQLPLIFQAILLSIGIFGTIIDGHIVYHYFIKRDLK